MDTAPAAAKAASVFTPGPATPASAAGGTSWILVVVAIVVMVGFIVALGYLIYDYFAYKKAATAAAEQDRKTALAHDRYIIDRTNVISGTLNSNVLDANSKADYLRAGFNSWSDDFSKALRFTSNMPVASAGGAGAAGAGGSGSAASGAFRIGQVPGAPIANLELLKHTSFVGGLTARELTSERAAALCGSGANSGRCIRFPDADGNTYLTGLTPEASVVLDAARTKVLGTLDFGAFGSLGSSDGGLFLGGENVAIGNFSMTDGRGSGDMNLLNTDPDVGLVYASKRSDEELNPAKMIKFMATRDGTVIMNGKGIVLSSDGEPYAMIGYDAEQKSVAIAAGPNGKIIVKGDVIMADDKAVFGTIGRDYDKNGVASGLRVSSVANNRLLLDTDVYLGDGRSLYGKVAGDTVKPAMIAAPAPVATAPAPVATAPAQTPEQLAQAAEWATKVAAAKEALTPTAMPYYTLLSALKKTLVADRAKFTALASLPEEMFNYSNDLPGFFAKYPFMDAVYKVVAYKNTAEFAALPEGDATTAEMAVNYWSPDFTIEFPAGNSTHIGVKLQYPGRVYMDNRDFFNARYGYPLIGR
jgi:hypothetical protein